MAGERLSNDLRLDYHNQIIALLDEALDVDGRAAIPRFVPPILNGLGREERSLRKNVERVFW